MIVHTVPPHAYNQNAIYSWVRDRIFPLGQQGTIIGRSQALCCETWSLAESIMQKLIDLSDKQSTCPKEMWRGRTTILPAASYKLLPTYLVRIQLLHRLLQKTCRCNRNRCSSSGRCRYVDNLMPRHRQPSPRTTEAISVLTYLLNTCP